MRASLVTASGRIATFVDEMLSCPSSFKDEFDKARESGLPAYCDRWESPAVIDPHFIADRVTELRVSNTMTVARTESGKFVIFEA